MFRLGWHPQHDATGPQVEPENQRFLACPGSTAALTWELRFERTTEVRGMCDIGFISLRKLSVWSYNNTSTWGK